MVQQEGHSRLYEEALHVATIAHREQLRKGSELPYIVHPVHVSVILLRHGFSVEIAVAGLLHDVVEDQGYELAEIEGRFGPLVREMVEELSERKHDAEGEKRAWDVRKREALERLRRGRPEVVAVKAADTLHNAHSFVRDLRREGPELWRHFNRGPRQQLDYYHHVLEIVRDRLRGHPLVAELGDAVNALRWAIDETGSEGEERKP